MPAASATQPATWFTKRWSLGGYANAASTSALRGWCVVVGGQTFPAQDGKHLPIGSRGRPQGARLSLQCPPGEARFYSPPPAAGEAQPSLPSVLPPPPIGTR